MAAAKSDPTTTKSIPKPDVVTPSDEELAAKLIEDSFPNLPNPEAKPEPTPTPKLEVEVAIVPQPLPEPEIINDFYESLGFPYCKKCGERRRTSDGVTAFCPIAKPNCAGFSG